MKRRINNQPGYSYTIYDEPQPGVYEMLRVVKREGKYRIRSSYNNTVTGAWVNELSSVAFDTVEEAIKATENPETLGFRFGYGESRVF